MATANPPRKKRAANTGTASNTPVMAAAKKKTRQANGAPPAGNSNRKVKILPTKRKAAPKAQRRPSSDRIPGRTAGY